MRIGVANVLGGEDDHASDDEQRVLAGFEHAHEPVNRRVRVAAAQTLDEGGNDVVVLFAALVIEQCLVLSSLFEQRQVDVSRFFLGGQGRRDLEGIERHPSVALGVLSKEQQRFLISGKLLSAKAAFLVLQGAPQQQQQVVRAQGFEDNHPSARQQRGDHLERRVLRRRAEEHDQALFHVRQEGVLLGLVEAVDFIDEQSRGLAVQPTLLLGFLKNLTELLDTGEHGRKGDERRLYRLRQEMRERRLATTRRSPQDQRRQGLARADLLEQAARAQQTCLADVFIECTRAHALGQRGFLGCNLCGTMGEQIVRTRWHQCAIIPKTRVKGRV